MSAAKSGVCVLSEKEVEKRLRRSLTGKRRKRKKSVRESERENVRKPVREKARRKIGKLFAKPRKEEVFGGDAEENALFEDRRGETAEEAEKQQEEHPRKRREIPAEKIPFTRTVFRAEGLNLSRLISAVSAETRVRILRSEERAVEFRVSSADKAKVVAILNRLCYDYIIIKEEGALFGAVAALRRAGIVAGIACSLAALIVYPHMITAVEATGEWNADVSRILASNGITVGKAVWNFDGDAVERQLLELDGVSFASVDKRGTRVYVNVRAERDGEHFVDLTRGNVTATVRASVTRAIVFSGTALVKYGDVVEAGQELIGGYVTVGEEKVACPADGEVYGKTYRTVTRFFPDTEIVRTEGASKSYTRLGFFGKQPAPPQSPFGQYVLRTSVWRNDFLLGYVKYTYTFTEITFAERQNTRTEEEMKKETLSSLMSSMPVGATVLGFTAQAERSEGGYTVTVTVEAEERIDNGI